MVDQFFDKKYVAYWKERVGNTSDGTKIPDEKVLEFFIDQLDIKKGEKILDLGCGFGRLYPFLSKVTSDVWGIEVNNENLEEAKKYPYRKLLKGTAEKTDLETSFFDKIVAWEVYDVVEQKAGLVEESRILKNGGIFLVTGKNNNYRDDDTLAFVAERNAKLKDFPNHFTDVLGLINNSQFFGFEVVRAYGFEKRGDFGELKYFDILDSASPKEFYQFMLFLKKVSEPQDNLPEICYEYSDKAKGKAKENDFENGREFFKWHKEKYGEKI